MAAERGLSVDHVTNRAVSAALRACFESTDSPRTPASDGSWRVDETCGAFPRPSPKRSRLSPVAPIASSLERASGLERDLAQFRLEQAHVLRRANSYIFRSLLKLRTKS